MKKRQELITNGYFVLENKLGQVVRTFNWPNDKLKMVYREDTRRFFPVDSTDQLDEDGIPYVVIADVKKSEIASKPLDIYNVGKLKLVASVQNTSPSTETFPEDDDKPFVLAKWTAGAQVAILALLMLTGALVNYFQKPKEEPQVVQIITKQELPPPPVVEPAREKIVEEKKIVKQAPPKKQKQMPLPKIVNKTAPKKREVPMNTIGALAVLGNMNKSANRGGLQVNNMATSRGPGLGGNAGSGGVQTSLYAKGLVAAPLGPGARADGAGGYGTRGKGGGQAGYGRMSLVGSSSAYFEPVESEAEIEGGLDREEIAEVIRRHLGQVRNCYEKGLTHNPGLSGRVAIKFLISPSGIVSTARVSNSSLRDGAVESCITNNLKGWKFPKPRGGVVVKVNYPFVLKRMSVG